MLGLSLILNFVLFATYYSVLGIYAGDVAVVFHSESAVYSSVQGLLLECFSACLTSLTLLLEFCVHQYHSLFLCLSVWVRKPQTSQGEKHVILQCNFLLAEESDFLSGKL